jgi:hypothetical protein
MNFLDPIAKNVLPSQNRSYQIPMDDQEFEILLRAIVHVSFIFLIKKKKYVDISLL